VVWDWVRRILQMSAAQAQENLELNFEHVLLAEELPADLKIPKKFWAIVRAVSSWEIWKARCKHYMENHHAAPAKIKTGQLDPDKAKMDMQRDFGTNTQIWYFHEIRLQVPPVPPRPP
jgi:hypothetical protein